MPVAEGGPHGTPDTEVFDPQAIITELPNGPQSPSEATSSAEAHLAEPHPGDERHAADEGGGAVPEEDERGKPFPEDMRADFEVLLAGRPLRKTFHWLGHRYSVRTLTAGELMDVGLLVKPFADTLGVTKAYQVATLAACIERVDDGPLPVPPVTAKANVSDIDPVLVDRFSHVRTWHPPTIDAVYEEFLVLEQRVSDVLSAMGNRSG